MRNKPIAIYTEKVFNSERCETEYFYKKVLTEADGDKRELLDMICNRRKLIQDELQEAKDNDDVISIEYYNSAILISLRYTTTTSIIENELEIKQEERGE